MILRFCSGSSGVCDGGHRAAPVRLWGGFRHSAMSPGGCARSWGGGRDAVQALLAGSVSVLWKCVCPWILSLSVFSSSSVHLSCQDVSPWTCSPECWSGLRAKPPLAFPRGRRFPLTAGEQWPCTGVVHSVQCPWQDSLRKPLLSELSELPGSAVSFLHEELLLLPSVMQVAREKNFVFQHNF